MYVKEFGSTDIGGSFYVECEGDKAYTTPGDFNYWHWKDDGDERYIRAMQESTLKGSCGILRENV